MTQAERALLLAVAEVVRGQYIGHPSKCNAMTALIAAVEAEAAPEAPSKSCETCAKEDEECPGRGCTISGHRYWAPKPTDADVCPVCRGAGMTVFNACQDMCWVCDGTGKKEKK